jgi:hypothetical protein
VNENTGVLDNKSASSAGNFRRLILPLAFNIKIKLEGAMGEQLTDQHNTKLIES